MNNNDNYNIDVIIPTYNQGIFIVDAIKSVEAQTLKPKNIYIIDDGSTDDTSTVVSEYIKNSPIQIVYRQKENGGPNSARNMGLSLSNSDFVAFLDGDDKWHKDKLQEQIDIYKNTSFKRLGLVYSKYETINSKGSVNTEAINVAIDKNIRGSAFEKLLSGNKILGSASAVLIKREVFSEIGIFDENLRFGEDWDMWLRIAQKYDIDFADKALVSIRRHNTNQTNDRSKVFLGEIDFYNKWSDKIANSYPAPSRWADVIILNLVVLAIKKQNIFKFIKKINRKTRKFIFKKTFSSIFIYFIYFTIKKIFDIKNQIKIIKRYAK